MNVILRLWIVSGPAYVYLQCPSYSSPGFGGSRWLCREMGVDTNPLWDWTNLVDSVPLKGGLSREGNWLLFVVGSRHADVNKAEFVEVL